MTLEVDVRHFKRGESTGRPFGGKVSDEQFPASLFALAKSHGFESQLGLAREIGVARTTVGKWYAGTSIPTPENFTKILQKFKPPIEESGPILILYSNLLEQGRGIKGWQHRVKR